LRSPMRYSAESVHVFAEARVGGSEHEERNGDTDKNEIVHLRTIQPATPVDLIKNRPGTVKKTLRPSI